MRRTLRLSLLLLIPAAMLVFVACREDEPVDPGAGLPEDLVEGTPTPDPLAEEGARVMLDDQRFISTGTVPAEAIDPTELKPAGDAEAEDGRMVAMARGEFDVIEEWALLSPADGEWIVWRPEAVLLVAEELEPGATFVAVERTDWPDSCLGLGEPDEVCAAVITPGYRVVAEVDGEEVEYRSNLAGDEIRRADDAGDGAE
jgi:hypothetical protein